MSSLPPYYTSGDALVTATMVKQYSYCPTLPWLESRIGLLEPLTPSMETARITADEKEAIARELGLPEPLRIETPVHDPELGATGVIDVIAGESRVDILEIKAHPRHPRRAKHFLNQLLVYALLAHRNIAPVHRAILYIGGETIEITINNYHLTKAKKLIEKTRQTIQNEDPPLLNQPPQKCKYCHYKTLCPNQP